MKDWKRKIKDVTLDVLDLTFYRVKLVISILEVAIEKVLTTLILFLKKLLIIGTFFALVFSVALAIYNSYEGNFLVGIYFIICSLVALYINKTTNID